MADLARAAPSLADLDAPTAAQLARDAAYASHIERQSDEVAALRRDEATALPPDIDYAAMSGLSAELRAKLERRRPATLAQAACIEGMTPAALLLLLGRARRPSRRSA
jgi:tRNA uridine 5-carboxymethylaminomethyl modification enzyme